MFLMENAYNAVMNLSLPNPVSWLNPKQEIKGQTIIVKKKTKTKTSKSKTFKKIKYLLDLWNAFRNAIHFMCNLQ